MQLIGGYYDPKKKVFVAFGSSRACGENYHKKSIHAEELAIKFCQKNDKRKRYQIIISKYNKKGEHCHKMSCRNCCNLAYRTNFQNKIFTINNDGDIINAISNNPELSLAYRIKPF